MDAYLFSTDHAGEFPPYLVVPDQNAARPGHPDGKSWVPWRPLKLEQSNLEGEASSINTTLENEGFYVSSAIISG